MGNFILIVIKISFSIFVLPVIFATTAVFYKHIDNFPGLYRNSFVNGVVTFVLCYLFLHSFSKIYDIIKKGIESAVQFTAPFNGILANIIPVFLLVVLGFFYLSEVVMDQSKYNHMFIFLTGFTFAFHIVLSARALRGNETGLGKLGYFFTIGIIFLSNVTMLVFVLDKIFDQAFFMRFVRTSFLESFHMYKVFLRYMIFWK
ncbi:MAG: hypothetical protein P9X22_03365 [Candidatus Zapsychrus exili]|nr:hypothetical protein [Candidatus Zapsychrus exili]